MAFTPPTPNDLKARFPAFGAVDDSVIQGALDEAGRQVDDTWLEGDRSLATLLYAAHVLTLDGFGTGAEAQAAKAGASAFQVMQSGALRLERFASAASGADSGGLGSTSYGQRFARLMRLNFPAVAIV